MIRLAEVEAQSAQVDDLVEKHRRFWRCAGEESTLFSSGVFAASVPVALPQPHGPSIVRAERLRPEMVDPAAMIDAVEAWDPAGQDAVEVAEGQTLAMLGIGDLMPYSQPFFKIPWLEAMLGCPIRMTEGQIWVERYEGDLARLIEQGIRFEHNAWFELYREFLRQLQARIGDRYPVTANTLLRGPSDLVAALMGVQEACIGWIERPAFMARLMRLCTDANLAVIEAGRALVEPFAGGYVSGFGVWAPGPVVRTQADHSSLLGPEMYARQILPFDREVIAACPACIFHIHNNGLHVAPYLAQIPDLDVIQVVVDPYPSGARKRYEVEMLRAIQEHKPLLLDVNAPSLAEADWLRSQLSPRGLCFNARFTPEVFQAATDDLEGSSFWRLA